MKSAIIINSPLLLAKAKYFVVKTEPHNEGALATALLEVVVAIIQCCTKYLEQSKEIKPNWTGIKTLISAFA